MIVIISRCARLLFCCHYHMVDLFDIFSLLICDSSLLMSWLQWVRSPSNPSDILITFAFWYGITFMLVSIFLVYYCSCIKCHLVISLNYCFLFNSQILSIYLYYDLNVSFLLVLFTAITCIFGPMSLKIKVFVRHLSWIQDIWNTFLFHACWKTVFLIMVLVWAEFSLTEVKPLSLSSFS